MIEIENEKLVQAYLAKHASDFCNTVGAINIRNICTLGDGDYRIMYNIKEEDKIIMKAIILKAPSK
jgi:mRNA-degrading endonuclease RelE of RelBE toxin-antitoxin system